MRKRLSDSESGSIRSEEDFTVTFNDGHRYAYACEPHGQTMNGEFFVFTPPPPPPPPPP